MPPRDNGYLALESISKTFGGVVALQDVSIVLRPEEITACVGPNGAGKSTLLNVMSGWAMPDSGSIRVEGRFLRPGVPELMAAAGIARTFQTSRVFVRQSVEANLMLAASSPASESVLAALFRSALIRESERSAATTTLWALDLMQLSHLRAQSCAHLSIGERRLVEIGMAIARKPRCLLLDEPTAGLSAGARTVLATALAALRPHTAIFLVEHDMTFVNNVADRIARMRSGRLSEEGMESNEP